MTIEERLAHLEVKIDQLEHCAAKMVDIVSKLQAQIGTTKGGLDTTQTEENISKKAMVIQFLAEIRDTTKVNPPSAAAETMWPLFSNMTRGLSPPCIQKLLDYIQEILQSLGLDPDQKTEIDCVMSRLTQRLQQHMNA